MQLENTGRALQDDRLERVNHASVAMVSCTNTPTTPPANKPPIPPTPTVMTPLTAQVGVPFSGTLAAFTDPEGSTLTYGLSELPSGLSLASTNRSSSAATANRVVSGTPTKAGTYALTYSATDEQGAKGSVTFNLTVNPAPVTSVVTGNFEGFLDKLECGSIRGWVWDRNKPNTPLTVEFYLETGSPVSTTILGRADAGIYRSDLKDAGKGNGAHAYNFAAPSGLKNGALVRARVLGSTYVLKGSPKTYQCASARLSAEDHAGIEVTVLGNPVITDVLEIEIRGAENQQLQLQLSDAQGRTIMEREVEWPGVIERQRLPVISQSAGLLWLRVSTASQSKTVKVLKSK
ncbi:hypothetical protein GCM10028803_33690 [Larkinella knui]